MSKSKFNTNGVLINRLNGATVNIITTKRMADLVEARAFIISINDQFKKSAESLNVTNYTPTYNGYRLDSWLKDIDFAVSRLEAKTTTTTTTFKTSNYDCTNQGCVESDKGQYKTLEECQKFCAKSVL